MKKDELLTIGQLAKQAGFSTSAIRYYEVEGLIQPAHRTASGYRMYEEQAVRTLSFIKRAQQLGFSLQDIRQLLAFQQGQQLELRSLVSLVEERFLEIERQVTNLLIQRHEMALFMQSVYDQVQGRPLMNGEELLTQMIEQVCADPFRRPVFQVLDWLIEVTQCHISYDEAYALLGDLRGMHFHMWRDEDIYYILVVSDKEEVFQALQKLADFEAGCTAHSSPESLPPGVTIEEEGFLLQAKGKNAFIYARLFMALEQEISQYP
ncbi:MAG: MerR family transcriptional regulator [Anaerolineaceae bacterium]|nr:MerR family transcriptional regulator [Anaerolineaceae bacterium]